MKNESREDLRESIGSKLAQIVALAEKIHEELNSKQNKSELARLSFGPENMSYIVDDARQPDEGFSALYQQDPTIKEIYEIEIRKREID